MVSDVITYWSANKSDIKKMPRSEQENLLVKMILTTFGFEKHPAINKVYPKWKDITREKVLERFQPFLKETLYKIIVDTKRPIKKRNKRFDKFRNDEEEEEDEDFNSIEEYKNYIRYWTMLEYLNSDQTDKLKKLEIIDEAMEYVPKSRYNMFPLEGDPVTFIGSTFMNAGDVVPYYNHGVCLGRCNEVKMENSECDIESYDNEEELLVAWVDMIKREKPNVIIGYNIFGFDWKFMYDRADELGCLGDFLELSRNKGALSVKKEKSIKIASGTHNLAYVEMDGTIQIDLYNHFKKSVNLGSYKLQDVGSHFIGDMVSNHEVVDDSTIIHSKFGWVRKNNYVCLK